MSQDPPVEVHKGVFIGSLASLDEDGLARQNIGAIINLSGKCYKNSRSVLNIVMDDIPVTIDTLDIYVKKFAIGVAAIEMALAADKCVLVHCAAGINRSATLIGLYLIERGLTYSAAVELLAAANSKRRVELLTNPSFRTILKMHSSLRENFTRRREELGKLSGAPGK
jgi:protein-tyrosine phosphatase